MPSSPAPMRRIWVAEEGMVCVVVVFWDCDGGVIMDLGAR